MRSPTEIPRQNQKTMPKSELVSEFIEKCEEMEREAIENYRNGEFLRLTIKSLRFSARFAETLSELGTPKNEETENN
jgi:hypothetical protein